MRVERVVFDAGAGRRKSGTHLFHEDAVAKLLRRSDVGIAACETRNQPLGEPLHGAKIAGG
jgi:hypothetical protein